MYLYQTKNVVYGVACFIHADLDRLCPVNTLVSCFPGSERGGDFRFRLRGNRYLYRLFYDGNDGRAFHFVGDGSLWFRGDLLRLAIEDVEAYAVTHAD